MPSTSIPQHGDSGIEVNSVPRIVVFENFLSGVEIERLLDVSATKMKQALVSADEEGIESPGRSGSNCWIPHRHDPIIAGLAGRVASVVGMPLDNAESFQVIHYGERQEYAPHFDAWDADTERGQRCMARGGQRMLTCLMYLNEPESGGGTCFPRLDMEVRARPGRMVVFNNCREGTSERHPDTLHGGMPVTRGEKWACNLWFRESSRAETPHTVQSSGFSRII